MGWMQTLVSGRMALGVLLAFAVSMGVATFIENDYGTRAARDQVYEAWWFEMLMLWLAVIFIAQMGRYKLLSRSRWPVGLFHLGFVVVLMGAALTRYFSEEGTMHIREGQTEQFFYSNERYIQLKTPDHQWLMQEPLRLNEMNFRPVQRRTEDAILDIHLKFAAYIPKARMEFGPGNDTLLDLAYVSGGERQDKLLRYGEALQLGGLLLAFGPSNEADAIIELAAGGWLIQSNEHLQTMDMASQQAGVLHAGETAALRLRSLYQWEGGAFLVKSAGSAVSVHYLTETDPQLAKSLADVVQVEIQAAGLHQTVYVPLVSVRPGWHQLQLADTSVLFTYGPLARILPFALKLEEFELDRYPGSQSPSSYASRVQVLDEAGHFPYRIFMNNVLDHRGYRFYQASYDTDEQGTVLAVNRDRPGTWLTYIGYTLLSLGMFFSFFASGSRFSMLRKRLRKVGVLALPFLLLGLGAHAHESRLPDSASVARWLVPHAQAEAYGRLVVQDLDGRMKPLNTLARELMRKLSGKSRMALPIEGGKLKLTAEQLLLAVQLAPDEFSRLPLIKVDERKGLLVFEALQHAPMATLSFLDLVDADGRYLLAEAVAEVNRFKPAERNEAQNEVLNVDERFNIFFALLNGDFLRLFPNRFDDNHTWFTAAQWQSGFDEEDARFVRNITAMYLAALQNGMLGGDMVEADEMLHYISLYQQKAGEAVYPSNARLQWELHYNRWQLGNRLFGWFWVLGTVMLLVQLGRIFSDVAWLKRLAQASLFLAWLGLLAFSLHLILRWYIAGHPPWSDGFEMLVFVAWGVLLFGLLFQAQSKFALPLGLLFSGTLLFVAFLDWLNPEITNLMPVLHSYWLKIHVAVIVSSYAPLALGAVMALLSLLLLVLVPTAKIPKVQQSLQELLMVNELALTIGLYLLAIGTFLGGVWANESWGRYWAWDPKETWALISVMVYAVVLHLRLVPGWYNLLAFNLAALWAFSSIIMTSFGVNYYLSGLHSYAKGNPLPVPGWVYVLSVMLLALSVLASWRYVRLRKQGVEL
ncbi:MAG: cytochrome c biogenesis protein CcsA [Bacteroidia bacterium]